jgi:putative acetyltransferase
MARESGPSRTPKQLLAGTEEAMSTGSPACAGDDGEHHGRMRIIDGDLYDARVLNLLRHHLTTARAQTAPGSAHALDVAGLRAPDISFWTIWDDETLLGCGALKTLAADHGEIKSMHTAQAMRRGGVGSAMLRHIVATARGRGMARLSLETGSWDFFRPAQAFYRRHGFVECGPFADYVLDPNSVFMTLELRAESPSTASPRPGRL